MNSELDRLLVMCSAGLGMVLVGGVNLLAGASRVRRIVTSLLIAAGAVGAVWAASLDPLPTAMTAAMLAAAILASVLAGSRRLSAIVSAVARLVHQPAARWGLLACAGLTTAIGSILAFERADQALIDQTAAEFEELCAIPPFRVAELQISTDRGTPIELREVIQARDAEELAKFEERVLSRDPVHGQVIRRQPGDDRANCHGWVFTGGRYWIGGASVDHILRDNDYQPVDRPRAGDLAVYRDSDNNILHTAIVRCVTPDQTVLVEGKWGCSGVYLHPVEASLYGPTVAYHRTARASHLLVGLGGPSSNSITPAR